MRSPANLTSIVDIEAVQLYPEHVDVVYSYHRLSYKYSQIVHWSGAAFVQVMDGSAGFLFLANWLMGHLTQRPMTRNLSQ